jgi:hypothetical protein
MQKIVLALLVVISFSAHAQTKLSWENIQGKWKGVAIELKDELYYDGEKDSLVFSNTARAEMLGQRQDTAEAIMMYKFQLKMMMSISIKFNRDSTAEITLLDIAEPEISRYSLDEKNSVIHSVNDKGSDHVMKAVMVGDKLRLLIAGENEESEMWILLKRD